MKTVLSEKNNKFIMYNELKGHEFIAYRSRTSSSSVINYCVLVKFKYSRDLPTPTAYGFMCLGKMDRHAVFVGLSASQAIENALAAGRDVKAFDRQEEMIKAMYDKSF